MDYNPENISDKVRSPVSKQITSSEHLLSWVVLHVTCQATNITLRSLFILEPELHSIQIFAFFKHPLLRPLLSEHGQVLEHQCHNIINMFDTFLCQVYIDNKESKAL